VAELKRKFKVAAHQIAQLKDEIEAKDLEVTSQMHQVAQKEKESEVQKAKINKCADEIKKLEIYKKSATNSINSL